MATNATDATTILEILVARLYLVRLQQRPKWNKPKQNLEVGQLVIIKDDRIPPSKWSLGRITAVHPGDDGFVGVITVRRRGTELKLPITKVCALPTNDVHEAP